jgi:hypothetical protein
VKKNMASQSKKFWQVKQILACHFYSLNCENGNVSKESYIIFLLFLNLSILIQLTWIFISNINIFSQLNDLVYMSCGKQMK